jgi:hypothetical protein
MGTIEDPKHFKSNEELKGIPLHFVEHKIEFNTIIPPSHQVQYCMNPNYAMVIKQDLDKLLAAGFIELVEQALGYH